MRIQNPESRIQKGKRADRELWLMCVLLGLLIIGCLKAAGVPTTGPGGGVNPTGNGSGLTNYATESNTFFVFKNGNDATAVQGDRKNCWLTVNAAILSANAARLAGQTSVAVRIGAGIFDEGTNILIPTNNMWIVGEGETNTIIKSEVIGTGGGPPCIGVNDGLVLKDLFIWGTLTDGNFQFPWGTGGGSSLAYLTNWAGVTYAYNCGFLGDSDCIYNNNPNSVVAGTLKLFNCDMYYRWDGNYTAGSTHTNVSENCRSYFIGASSTTGANGVARAYVVGGGSLIIRNSYIENTNYAGGACIGVTSASPNSKAFLQNDVFNVPFTNILSTSNADVVGGTLGTSSTKMTGCMRLDGTPLQVIKQGATAIVYAGNIDPGEIRELTTGTPLSLPTRAVNLGGTVTITNTFNLVTGATTLNTNQFAVSSTGWTNTNTVNCTVYITTATGATIALSDGTNQIFSVAGVTTTAASLPDDIQMGPGYTLVVSAGTITGKATVSH